MLKIVKVCLYRKTVCLGTVASSIFLLDLAEQSLDLGYVFCRGSLVFQCLDPRAYLDVMDGSL